MQRENGWKSQNDVICEIKKVGKKKIEIQNDLLKCGVETPKKLSECLPRCAHLKRHVIKFV
jgi:hypothetical protein